MLILGITGTLGAGKGTVVEYLVSQKGFKHFSVREYLSERIRKEGHKVDRDAMVEIGNRLRTKYGPSFLAEELFKEAQKSQKDCIIESLRAEGEINALRKKGKFYLIAVDAKPRLRYERIISRASETDKISYKEFLQNEKREMYSKDPSKQNLSRCMELADFKIENNSTIKDLNKKIEEVIIKNEK